MKNVYFISDFHLGLDTDVPSRIRERHIVNWLDSIKHNAAEIYLLGDILDFWFEYQSVVPKGYTRLFGKIAELTDAGIPIEWYTGNHDMWTFGYLESELGVKIKKRPQIKMINGKSCYLCHGDGLGKGDRSYKLIKVLFASPICQFLYSLIPSRIGIWLMKNLSNTSRVNHKNSENKDIRRETELQSHFEKLLVDHPIDYFIYGHFHNGKVMPIGNDGGQSINLGDWTSKWSYAVMNHTGELKLQHFAIPS